jgi:secreted trypsin-like serine protease
MILELFFFHFKGDSGGPLFYYEANNPEPILIGVFSTNDKSGGVIDQKPLVFANVGAYRKWIDTTLSKLQ